jgi:hypothetical protein
LAQKFKGQHFQKFETSMETGRRLPIPIEDLFHFPNLDEVMGLTLSEVVNVVV